MSLVFFKTILLVLIFAVCSGLTFHEASSIYGSSILVCSSDKSGEKTLRYWSLVKKYPKKQDGNAEDLILDLLSRKSYKIGDCVAFKCSPEPWRLTGCELN